MPHKLLRSLVICFCTGLSMTSHLLANDYDVVITNGRVMDPESNLDAVRHIGISNGEIVEITGEEITGKKNIDASGMVVAPGFIDLHAHGQNDVANRYQAMDGVTTALEMEIGVHKVKDWYASRRGKALLNYGATVNHIYLRGQLLLGREVGMDEGFDVVGAGNIVGIELSASQTDTLMAALKRGLDEGALGVGLGIQYVPGARREEIYRIFKLAKSHSVPVFVHARTASIKEPDSIGALQELISNSAATGTGVHFAHIGSIGGSQTPVMLDMIKGANRHGIDISTEIYPYKAASTAIGAAIFSDGWRAKIGADYGDLEWVQTGERLTEETFRQYRKEEPGGGVIVHFIPAEIVDLGVADPIVMIASDGGSWVQGRGHPRGAGSFSRVLGRYVRDNHSLTLMAALRKMTLLPAQRLEKAVPVMSKKGRLKKGADADVVIFDPDTIIDNATFSEPMQFSTGVKHLLVGGQAVVREGELVKDVFPGQAVRR